MVPLALTYPSPPVKLDINKAPLMLYPGFPAIFITTLKSPAIKDF
jgi:hypothetical protein